MANEPVIKTSQSGWLEKLAGIYRKREHAILVDDAELGVDPGRDSLLSMGKRARLSAREWSAILIALGVAATGTYLLVMAILDPEPFSKMGMAIGSGTLLVLGGGLMAIRVLTRIKPPNVRVSARGFEIGWDD
jgi:hypothetical protein